MKPSSASWLTRTPLAATAALLIGGALACSSVPPATTDAGTDGSPADATGGPVDDSAWTADRVAVVVADDEDDGVRWAADDLARTAALLLGEDRPLPLVDSSAAN